MIVTLKEMRLRNFKGVADATFTFGPRTIVKGTNGTGKTTLVDAYNFCLFGKDSKGRSDANFKRRDPSADYAVMHKMEYAVEVLLDVDGKEKRFERVLTEKWTRKRGDADQSLTGHESQFYIDRVKCATKREFDNAVSELASEEFLRMVTDPYHFVSQKDDVKKAMLLRMAFGTNDADEANSVAASDVLSKDSSFGEFVQMLGNKQVEKFIKENASKIRDVKRELEDIPIKISAKKEACPKKYDWKGLEEQIVEHQKKVESCNQEIASIVAGSNIDVSAQTQAKINSKKAELNSRESVVRSSVNAQNSECRDRIDTYSRRLFYYESEINENRKKYDECVRSQCKINDELTQMREAYKQIKSGNYKFSPAEMSCPTCGRPYDQSQLIQAKLAENTALGKAKVAELNDITQQCAIFKDRLDKAVEQKKALGEKPEDTTRNVEECIKNDNMCVALRAEISELLKKYNECKGGVYIPDEITKAKENAEYNVSLCQQMLCNRDVILHIEKQIQELEEKQKALNEELANYEKLESTAISFQKAKDETLIKRVNSLFKIVTWDFSSEQLNGSERLTCNCYVEGIPYSEKNKAGQINAGLDIINAICANEGISMPIFVDNAESVVDVLGTSSQQILLAVSSIHQELSIENQ